MTADRNSKLATETPAIGKAAELLRAGRLVAFPTETVYGLGADARHDRAVADIFAVKGRPQFNPLIVHVPGIAAAAELAAFDPVSLRLAEKFWPGPFTLVLKRRENCGLSLLVSAGLDTVALRVPAHPLALELLAAADCPIAAPSANLSGRVSPTLAAHVEEQLGDRISLVLDGGPCGVGLESTVVQVMDGRVFLLRPGGVTRDEIAAIAGSAEAGAQTAVAPRSPGQLASHYAPHAPLRLNALTATPGEAGLGFGGAVPEGAVKTLNLSASGDLGEAAANLFAMLRRLDQPGCTGIAVAPIPAHGLGEAINDRLRRAAHG